jgi:hypothetical protein
VNRLKENLRKTRPYCIYIWNREELSEEWKDLIIVPIFKKGNKTGCVDYRGRSLLPTTYKILFNILLSRFTSYTEEMWISTQQVNN